MKKDFKAACGCEIHIIKWSSKHDMASVKNCALHKNAAILLAACKEAALGMLYRLDEVQHTAIFNKLKAAIRLAEGEADAET